MLNVSQTLRQFWFSVSVFVPATFLASSEGDGGGKDALCQKHLRDVERLLWFYLVLLNKNFQFFTFVFFISHELDVTCWSDCTVWKLCSVMRFAVLPVAMMSPGAESLDKMGIRLSWMLNNWLQRWARWREQPLLSCRKKRSRCFHLQ